MKSARAPLQTGLRAGGSVIQIVSIREAKSNQLPGKRPRLPIVASAAHSVAASRWRETSTAAMDRSSIADAARPHWMPYATALTTL